MKSTLIIAAAFVLFPATAAADDVAARSLVATCANCHGTAGHSVTKTVEPLAGKPKARIIELMQAFRSGKKPSTIMQQISKGYTDQQIALMAGYLSDQRK